MEEYMKSETVLQKYRVLIVDDHPVVRYGIGRILNAEPDLTVCGEADDGPAALLALQRTSPHVVLLDISLKTMDGLTLLRRMLRMSPDLPVLVLSMHQESVYARKAITAGARGYVMKEESPTRLVDAVRRTLKGETVLSPTMQRRMLADSPSGEVARQHIADVLSDRERHIFMLYGQGLNARQIAEQLKVSMKTIETHRARIRFKLNLSSGADFVFAAVDWANDQAEAQVPV
jgi:DNA-binding NarL/FixJ family response regulator